MGQTIQIATDGMHCIGAYRADPAGAPRGGIVVVQEIFGVNAHIRSVVDRFAAAGYTAIAPAVFDHIETGVELGYDEAGVARGRTLAAEVGFDRAVAAVGSAAEAIASSGKVGVTGFCWGGTVSFLSATRLALPAVVYYGGRSVPFLAEPAKAPLLFHFGEKDPLIPPEDVARHRAAQPQAEFHLYPAGHGFNCDQRADFDPASAALALERTLAFFARELVPARQS
ncbi:dienelactone hydrolase family protein [Tahibacter amnicola]|uniref:Dienelactone hydrolase family protein n=1 Tax=Tahibacter amnicola TaxID=2976241 RepID=A0ABY6BHS6_9GAMM|nr:dienelactone hydrolase family protein [Tahibacter amnicola]MCU7372921.1 dienelactone hydrolase family protein [Paucibacter sp. O1-1]MDA3827917.1 dienelactone hydrolase family protein [Paucibacter sp. O1-1]UXI69559.1 dienelactone hydrolase family protein [Tahibacter amnicola]